MHWNNTQALQYPKKAGVSMAIFQGMHGFERDAIFLLDNAKVITLKPG
jgi:hypothetical protein